MEGGHLYMEVYIIIITIQAPPYLPVYLLLELQAPNGWVLARDNNNIMVYLNT